MTIRVALLPYGPSDSCRLLRDELSTVFENNANIRPRLLRLEGSAFQGRAGDIIINYGNRSAPATLFGQALVLNPQAALNNAANKLNALNLMRQHNVSTIEFTTNLSEAQAWVAGGSTVYSRSTLNGHSGEGIETWNDPNAVSRMPNVPLYTKGIVGQRREWRVHVFKGVITYVQVKRRRNGYQEDPNYSETIRNHHTGWIYATENINPSQSVLRNAVAAVAALGLDFGAVDIISRNDDAWVLEVNTAAGLSGTTLEVFRDAVVEFINSRAENRPPQYTARFPTPAPVAPPAPEVSVEAPVTARSAATEVGGEQVQDARRASGTVREDGYYVASVSNQSGRVSQTDVILWSSNGRFFRHGWNAPVDSSRVSNIRKVASVTTTNGVVINTVGAIQ